MLNGVDPVLIFQFKEVLKEEGELNFEIPVVSTVERFIESRPIPIYLSERLTGIFIDSEDKNIDIETSVITNDEGTDHATSQQGIDSSVTINLKAKRDSVGLILLSALMDKVFNKVTSDEYAVSYLHGATTIFRGKVQSYQVNQAFNNDLMLIQLIISIGAKAPKVVNGAPVVPRDTSSEITLKGQG